MRTIDFTVNIFGWIFSLYLDVYPAVRREHKTGYGSTSNFGKWKTAPLGSPVNPYNVTKKKRTRKK
jgi:hypothetical protein